MGSIELSGLASALYPFKYNQSTPRTWVCHLNVSDRITTLFTPALVQLCVADGTLATVGNFRGGRISVNSAESLSAQELQAEVSRLQEEVQMRDRLVQQLSQELFRLVKGNANFTPNPEVSEQHHAQMQLLRQQLEEVEQQVEFYQAQISERDSHLLEERQAVRELTDRARMLEQVVQELPEIYRQKFAERLAPVKERVEMLQKENRKLHAELQSVSYRLAMRSRRSSGQLDLPSFKPSNANASLPSFGGA